MLRKPLGEIVGPSTVQKFTTVNKKHLIDVLVIALYPVDIDL